MEFHYTAEKNIQIVISLLKTHGIKRVVASPGATDVAINASLQQDPYFEMYSCIDERSAAYMACGMAAESGEPIAITCTGATSSRNYMPALTEAFYRQLPILAITCCRSISNVGHYVDQVTDRSQLPNDIARVSVYAQSINCPEDEWDVMIKVNRAILGLTHNGGGPCHINLATTNKPDFTVKNLPFVRTIKRYTKVDDFPDFPMVSRVCIFVGAHRAWSMELTHAVDAFCSKHNAVVLCDPTSNYKGKYRLLFPIICEQAEEKIGGIEPFDLAIHIGNVSSMLFKKAKQIWRVNPDGEVRDTFRKLYYVFQMDELSFFQHYLNCDDVENKLYAELINHRNKLMSSIPDLPFSNVWVAGKIEPRLPENSVLHLGIRNSLRSWGYYDTPESVLSYCNTGGFGIDGGMSSLVGASFINKDKLYFGVFGDLLFFYDMNSLGNRDITSNLRIIVINNGLGQEFKNYSCSSSLLGDATDKFIAARGHYGNQSHTLIKSYALSLGFEYYAASTKEEFEGMYEMFISPEITSKPMLLEIFVKTEDESKAHEIMTTLTTKSKIVKKTDELSKKPGINKVRDIIKKRIS